MTRKQFLRALASGRKDFAGEDLSNLDLSGLNLEGLNLRGCDLSNTELYEAKMDTTDINGAKVDVFSLLDALISGVIFDEVHIK